MRKTKIVCLAIVLCVVLSGCSMLNGNTIFKDGKEVNRTIENIQEINLSGGKKQVVAYDKNNKRISSTIFTREDKKEYFSEYNKDDLLTKTIMYDENGEILKTTIYEYQNTLKVKHTVYDSDNKMENYTIIEYDNQKRVKKETVYVENDVKAIENEYYPSGMIYKTIIYGKNSEVISEIIYDDLPASTKEIVE